MVDMIDPARIATCTAEMETKYNTIMVEAADLKRQLKTYRKVMAALEPRSGTKRVAKNGRAGKNGREDSKVKASPASEAIQKFLSDGKERSLKEIAEQLKNDFAYLTVSRALRGKGFKKVSHGVYAAA